MKITYGCDCSNCGIHNKEENDKIPEFAKSMFAYPYKDPKTTPVIKQVLRDGKKLNVCTRCVLPSRDEVVKVLIDQKTDKKPFFEYDELGAMVEFMELKT